jgi:polysaccharide export outer membrane protein
MKHSNVIVTGLKYFDCEYIQASKIIMPKPVLLSTVSLTMFILLMFLALPCISSAEQIENIPETEQQLQPVEKTEQERPTAERLEQNRPAPETATAGKMPSEKSEPDQLTAEKIEQEHIAAEKIAVEKPAAVMTGQERAPVTNTPVTPLKTASAPSSSMWLGFLAALGLHDDRPSIPPVEVTGSASNPEQDYIIGPGDLLSVSVWRDDSLTRSVVVLPDGKIQFPLIGEVVAGGKTVAQLKQIFVDKLSSYVVDADISVEVKQSNSLIIYIIGRVNSPGRQMLVADTTVLQALAMAGGVNPFAEKDDIKIFRQDKDRTLVYSFRYSQVVSGNYLNDNLLLKRGDVIVVP